LSFGKQQVALRVTARSAAVLTNDFTQHQAALIMSRDLLTFYYETNNVLLELTRSLSCILR